VSAIPPAEAQKLYKSISLTVEGGQATLFVTPEGQSLLIDTGWPGNDGRDAGRIVAAAKSAGPDGNFEVFNSRTQATKRYAPAH